MLKVEAVHVHIDNLSLFIPLFPSTTVFVSVCLSVCVSVLLSVSLVCILSMYSLAQLHPQTLYIHPKKKNQHFLRRVTQTNTAGPDKSISAQYDEKASKSLNCHQATQLEETTSSYTPFTPLCKWKHGFIKYLQDSGTQSSLTEAMCRPRILSLIHLRLCWSYNALRLTARGQVHRRWESM